MKAGGRDRGSFAGEVAGISFSDGTDSWSLAPKACDFCKSSAAVLFCRADSAFLCTDCDLKVHAANKLASRHERVWMCEVCEQAPASVTCKADAAALCVACDNDIHSANPLARRHERYPVVPFYEPAAVAKASAAASFLVPAVDGDGLLSGEAEEEGEDVDENGNVNSKSEDAEAEAEAASWLLPNPKDCEMKTGGDYFFPEVDPYLDLEYASPIDRSFHHHHHHHNGSDSVVPVQKAVPVMNTTLCGTDLESNFGRSSKPKFGYATSISHSVSSSTSLDVGVVPDGSSLTDISNPYSRGVMKTTMDLCSPNSTIPSVTVTQLSPLDREARVLRYREKRKNRKFEKTIRYVSRKAYAETRPRIKGRFAKRTEIEVEVDRIYSSASILMAETGYGIVPSF